VAPVFTVAEPDDDGPASAPTLPVDEAPEPD